MVIISDTDENVMCECEFCGEYIKRTSEEADWIRDHIDPETGSVEGLKCTSCGKGGKRNRPTCGDPICAYYGVGTRRCRRYPSVDIFTSMGDWCGEHSDFEAYLKSIEGGGPD